MAGVKSRGKEPTAAGCVLAIILAIFFAWALVTGVFKNGDTNARATNYSTPEQYCSNPINSGLAKTLSVADGITYDAACMGMWQAHKKSSP
jgi:hypothetical protein